MASFAGNGLDYDFFYFCLFSDGLFLPLLCQSPTLGEATSTRILANDPLINGPVPTASLSHAIEEPRDFSPQKISGGLNLDQFWLVVSE